MELKFVDGTNLEVDNFYYEGMSKQLYIYLYSDDFNSLIPIFVKENLTSIITKSQDEQETYDGFVNIRQFFGVVNDGKLLVTIVLGNDDVL